MDEKNDLCCGNSERVQSNEKQGKKRDQGCNDLPVSAKSAFDGETTEQNLLQHQVDILEQEKEELTRKLLRLQADFDNFRKRTRAEKEEMVDYAAYDLVCRLLPVIDNMERACASTDKGSQGIAEGVAMIARQLKELLEKEGVKAIDCTGKPFDPACHEAVLRTESSEHPPNTVVEELQKGYMLKDRIIRPSMVKVAVKE